MRASRQTSTLTLDSDNADLRKNIHVFAQQKKATLMRLPFLFVQKPRCGGTDGDVFRGMSFFICRLR